jgi:hypothetical protein
MLMGGYLQLFSGSRVHCSLWDQYALRMDAYLTTRDPSSPVVVILNLCKLKKYYGAMGISNAFFGTKLILDDDSPVVKEYRAKYGHYITIGFLFRSPYWKFCLLIFFFLNRRIDGAEISVTQGVSQSSGALIVPLADDMMQTKMLTIEDLIESSDV